MTKNKKILYIGGFQLPDKNAAAHRVIGIAKGFNTLGYEVCFLNSLKNINMQQEIVKYYFGFKCYEYKRESNVDYLLTARTCISKVKSIKPDILIAYNYPAFALEKIRKYCKNNNIKCYGDVTEWYQVNNGISIYRVIITIDTLYRMKVVQKRLDGIIAISRFLYDYYKGKVRTVNVPPTVDITDKKWEQNNIKKDNGATFIYVGSPSAQKERLDLIVDAVESVNFKDLKFNIVGITESDYRRMYNYSAHISDKVKFWGRVEHSIALKLIKQANWAIVIRDNNFVVNAGFPTKLVECISAGTPVIINKFSNVDDYLKKDDCIFVNNVDELPQILIEACGLKIEPNKNKFDYHEYVKQLNYLISE